MHIIYKLFNVTNDGKRIYFTFTSIRNKFCFIKLTQFEALVLNTIPQNYSSSLALTARDDAHMRILYYS